MKATRHIVSESSLLLQKKQTDFLQIIQDTQHYALKHIPPTEARSVVLGERKPTPPEGNYQLTEIP